MKTEPNVFVFRDLPLFVMTYVDDIVAIGPEDKVSNFFGALEKHLLIKDLAPGGPTIAFLGRLVNQDDKGIHLRAHED